MDHTTATPTPLRFALLALPGLMASVFLLVITVYFDMARGSSILPLFSVLAYLTLGVTPALQTTELAKWLGRPKGRYHPAILIAWLFPIWLIAAAMIGMGYGAPMAASIAWAIVIGCCVHVAFSIPILIAGAVSNAVYYFADDPTAGLWGIADWAHPVSIASWHVVAAIGLWLTTLVIPEPAIRAGKCTGCGYLIKGLPTRICPECGCDWSIEK